MGQEGITGQAHDQAPSSTGAANDITVLICDTP